MIPYIEILDKYTLKAFYQIEPNECWFELSYYEMGEFEIYCVATKKNLEALKLGHFVKIPNKRFLWFITSIEYTFTAETKTRMIVAKGKEAKFLLDKRIIKDPMEFKTNLSTAVRQLFNKNIGKNAVESRQIENFVCADFNKDLSISTIQAPRENLYEYLSTLLKSYNYGAYSTIENGIIYYIPFIGEDKSKYVKFSQSFDNLLSCSYYTTDEKLKTFARTVSNVEDVDYIQDYDKSYNGEYKKGIDRSELLVSSNLSTEYTPDGASESVKLDLINKPNDLALYKTWLANEGKIKLAENLIIEEVSGEIDLVNSQYKFDDDFFLGDLVLIKDEYFNINFKARILKLTMSQDAKTYSEKMEYSAD